MTLRWLVLSLTTALMSSSAIAGAPALAATRCVGTQPGCFAGLQDALDAAHDGDTVRLERGTFVGGAVVTKSVAIVGDGQHATIVSGGGPVLRIGTLFDPAPPTVSIRDLTITGGRTASSSLADFIGEGDFLAHGGGIEIPRGDGGPGATVTIARTSIVGNRAAPSATVDSGLDCGSACPFAAAKGGGIYNEGTLTISDSAISGNRVGTAAGLSALTSDAEGAGIYSRFGPLTILRSRIEDNQATATPPYGRFADGGGVFNLDSPFVMRDSSVSGNRAHLDAGFASDVETLAVAGGVHLTDGVPTGEITRSVIARNSVGITNTVGDAITFSGGLHVDAPVDFKIGDSLIAGNHVDSATLGSSRGLAHADGGAGQLFGQMTRTRVVDNAVTANSVGGDAEAMAGGSWVLRADVSDSQLRGNQLLATAANGEARVRGGGAVVDTPDPEHPEIGGLSLTGASISGNSATAAGRSSLGQGGGIFDAAVNGPFGGPLVLVDSSVTRNVLSGPPSAPLQGGGVFLDGFSLTQTNSAITRNVPDQCFGCPGTVQAEVSTHHGAARTAIAERRRALTAHWRRERFYQLAG
jgi:hypothetical protein